MRERKKPAGYEVRDVGGGLEGKYFCYETKKSIYGRPGLRHREQEGTKDMGRMLAEKESRAGIKGAFTMLTPSHALLPQVSASHRLPRGV